MHPRVTPALLALALLAPLACGGYRGDGAEGAGQGSGGTAAAYSHVEAGSPATATAAADDPAASITPADIDVYERGLAAEVALVRSAVTGLRAARSGQDTLAAMSAALDMQTQPAAARAAGISVQRYRHLDNVFGGAISARKMNPALTGIMATVDTSDIGTMPPDVQQRMRANMRDAQAQFSDSSTYHNIPPELRDAFKRRASARLDTLWSELFSLRARAAGLAR
jgi:hypothetical protein